MPLTPEQTQKVNRWVRKAHVPERLVHFTRAEQFPDIIKSRYLKPRVSAIGLYDERALRQLEFIMPLPLEKMTPIFIPKEENKKFKRVVYPYQDTPLINEMIKTGELEMVTKGEVAKDYGPSFWRFTQKPLYVEKLELVSDEIINLKTSL